MRSLMTMTVVAAALSCPLEVGAQRAPAAVRWPTATWAVSSPEAQGISSHDLADALDFARANDVNIHSLTLVRNGVIVLDAYFYPFAPDTRHDVASVTKSVTSILVGMAIADGHLA